MNCVASSCQGDDQVPLPIETPGTAVTPSRRRNAALQYLEAANRSADGLERDQLRRRAADLILPRKRMVKTRRSR
jgi:hypothetical protein